MKMMKLQRRLLREKYPSVRSVFSEDFQDIVVICPPFTLNHILIYNLKCFF